MTNEEAVYLLENIRDLSPVLSIRETEAINLAVTAIKELDRRNKAIETNDDPGLW